MRITTLLSLAGVLSAGSAAAVVNNQVLTSAGADAKAEIAIDAALEPAIEIESAALAATEVMFQVRDAGFVTLDTAADTLTIVAATANDGWQVVDAQLTAGLQAVVLFHNGSAVVEFTASLLADGDIATTVAPPREGVAGAYGNYDGTTYGGSNGAGTSNGVSGGANGNGATGVADANGSVDDDDNAGNSGSNNCGSGLISVCVDAKGSAHVNDD